MPAEVSTVLTNAFIFFFSGFAFGIIVRVLKQLTEKI